jgi:hypothetical protein
MQIVHTAPQSAKLCPTVCPPTFPIMVSKFVVQFLTVASLAAVTQPAMSAELTPYLRATPQGQPHSDIGFNFAADALDLRGAITTSLAGNTTLIAPQLVSSFALAPDFKFETRATFSNWNENGGQLGGAVETRLTARSPLPMFAEIEGLVGRDAGGESHRKLRFKMNDTRIPTFLSEPLLLKANASIEQVGAGNAPNTLLTGVEAALVQQASASSAYNRLGFKYTTQTGAIEDQRQAATFTRSWAQNDLLRLGIECELIRDAADLQSAVRFTWQGHF